MLPMKHAAFRAQQEEQELQAKPRVLNALHVDNDFIHILIGFDASLWKGSIIRSMNKTRVTNEKE